MSTEVKEEEVKTVEIDLEEFLGTPGSENIILPEDKKKEEDKKTSIFTPRGVDTSFLDTEEEEEEEDDPEDPEKKKVKEIDPVKAAAAVDSIVKELDNPEEEEEEEDDKKKTAGRKKVDKSGLTELFKGLIEKEKIVPFDEEKSIDDYSVSDFEELMLANLEHMEKVQQEKIQDEFINSLPDELQIAAKYVLVDKGKDIKGILRLLGEVREVRELDVEDEQDQEIIAREFLHSTGFGTSDEIDEEISAWKDQKTLKAKAEKFKAKLDKIKADKVSQELAANADRAAKNQAAAKKYVDDIYDTLKDATINGIKLDKKTQNAIYMGLVQPSYTSQVTGKPTNMLGYLLEKHQVIEPNHALIAEALYLLKDPEGYRAKVREMGAVEETKKIVKTLKTEESKKSVSSPVVEEEEKSKKKIPRTNSFFKPL